MLVLAPDVLPLFSSGCVLSAVTTAIFILWRTQRRVSKADAQMNGGLSSL